MLSRLKRGAGILTAIANERYMALVPVVVESSRHGERAFDIYSRLLRERIIMVHHLIMHHYVTTCCQHCHQIELLGRQSFTHMAWAEFKLLYRSTDR